VKALVLSGGNGTRLRPFSHTTPKQLIPVANRPVLFRALDDLRAVGVTAASIVVSAPGTAIRAAVGDGSRFGMAVTYLPQDAPRGLAHCVMIARDFLGDDDFVMYLADNIFIGGLAEACAQFRAERPDVQLVVTKVPNPSESGVAELDASGRVVGLQEKPAQPRGDLAVTGAYFFTSVIHEAVHRIAPSRRNELEITDALQWLVDQGRQVRACLYGGQWKDTGTLGDVLECNKLLLEEITPEIAGSVDAASRLSGPVVVEPGAVVRRSTVTGPAIIGNGAVVEESHIGAFTSVGNECRLHQAGVEYSILLDRASVRGVRGIHGSIIGRDGQVNRRRDGQSLHRLLVSDHSVLEVPQ
jgi:glucose-1-phosphate thymidylyltransferase